MDFEQREDTDGVRLSWNVLPRSRMQHQRNVVPLSALYTPMVHGAEVQQAEQTSITICRQCQAFGSPFCSGVEGGWFCGFCGFQNRLAADTLAFQHSTIEYDTGRMGKPPVFLFVVDIAFSKEDDTAFESVIGCLEDQLSQLPVNSLVGFISFGENVFIHETGSTLGNHKSWAFNGEKNYNLEQLKTQLGLLDTNLRANPVADGNYHEILGPIAQRFLTRIDDESDYNIRDIIRTLQANCFPRQTHQRYGRCTGSAINIAMLLLKAIFGQNIISGHILSYVGGPCTRGPGIIVGQSLKEPLRSHHDIEKANSQLVKTENRTKSGRKFYGEIAEQLVQMGISCSILIGSYDQVGLFEMEALCNRTGGDIIMCDSFDTTMFRQSNNLLRSQQLCYNGTLEVRTSSTSGLKISGMIGNGRKIPHKKGNKYVEDSISAIAVGGESGSNCWKCCNVGPSSTYAIYFDKNDSSSDAHIQFIFNYQDEEGKIKVRVTTVSIPTVVDNEVQLLEQGFDQETALIIIARELVYRLQAQEARDPEKKISSEDIPGLLDKKLIDYCARFALYNKNQFDSFRLSNSYSMFPQFMYHLRRSQLIRVFNNSPDETSYIRHAFFKEDLTSSLTMIQPTLMSYDIDNFDGEQVPVLLDSESLGPNKILLLDTFFHVLIYHGKTIAEWRKAGYHEKEDYEYFKTFLEAPKSDAMQILMDRFPLPRFIDCDEGGSQARFLMAKLNPSQSYSLPSFGGNTKVLTDDTSLQVFMEHVQRVVVNK